MRRASSAADVRTISRLVTSKRWRDTGSRRAPLAEFPRLFITVRSALRARAASRLFSGRVKRGSMRQDELGMAPRTSSFTCSASPLSSSCSARFSIIHHCRISSDAVSHCRFLASAISNCCPILSAALPLVRNCSSIFSDWSAARLASMVCASSLMWYASSASAMASVASRTAREVWSTREVQVWEAWERASRSSSSSPHPSINFSNNLSKFTPLSSGQCTYSSRALCHLASRSLATSACVPSIGVSISRTMAAASFLSASDFASHFFRLSTRSLHDDASLPLPPLPPLPPPPPLAAASFSLNFRTLAAWFAASASAARSISLNVAFALLRERRLSSLGSTTSR
mmetsp:Transcript_4632/g.9977  ORF Transcript_4632/g.9977 Transcript_4632/m.9977 type:complete len:344 (+) Transcript_4632:3754-4785(+)